LKSDFKLISFKQSYIDIPYLQIWILPYSYVPIIYSSSKTHGLLVFLTNSYTSSNRLVSLSLSSTGFLNVPWNTQSFNLLKSALNHFQCQRTSNSKTPPF